MALCQHSSPSASGPCLLVHIGYDVKSRSAAVIMRVIEVSPFSADGTFYDTQRCLKSNRPLHNDTVTGC
jgi:hypothetical protein